MTYEELIKKLSPKLKAITRKLDGRYTVFSDDDLYQEALFYLWEKYQSDALQDKTDSYILQGCYFFLKNYIRKNFKSIDRKTSSLSAPLNNDSAGEDEATMLERLAGQTGADCRNAVEANILRKDLNKLLLKRDRNILFLQARGFTCREIAIRLGVSHVSVVKIQKRIKSQCVKLLLD